MATQTAPAPAAPAAPAPSAPAPTGSGAGDPIEQLRNDTIAWSKGGGESPSETTTETPATESTSAAPEATPSVGTNPPSEGQPATDAPTSSAHDSWVKRYGDPEKAASEAYALEQRASAMAQRIKELESAQPTQTETPQVAAPTAAQPPAQPATPAPAPAPQAPSVMTDDQVIEYALANDGQCRDLIGQFNTKSAQLKALVDTEIPALQKAIADADVIIAHPNADELLKQDARDTKQRAEMTLSAREATAAKLDLNIEKLDIQFRSRLGEHSSYLHEQTALKAREAEIAQDAETKATEFVGSWASSFDAEFKAQGIDPEMRAEIHDAVKNMALARPGRIDLKDLTPFLKSAIKAEFDKVDKYHRIQARQHALRKNADTNPTAPVGAAATATEVSAPVTTEDQLKALRDGTRALFRSRRGA